MADTEEITFDQALEAHVSEALTAMPPESTPEPGDKPEGTDEEAPALDDTEPGDVQEQAEDEQDPEESVEEDEDRDVEALEVTEDTVITLPDGRTVKVKDGLSMQADYTRKTQELSEARRELEAKQAEVQTAYQELQTWAEQKAADPSGWAAEVIESSGDATATLAKTIISLNKAGRLSPEFAATFDLEPVKTAANQATVTDEVAELRRRLEERERQEAEQARTRQIVSEYEQQWQQVKNAEGLKFDAPQAEAKAKLELLAYAREHEIVDLPTAYAAFAYQRAKQGPSSRQQAKQAVSRKRAAQAISPRSAGGGAAKSSGPVDLDQLIREGMAELETRSA